MTDLAFPVISFQPFLSGTEDEQRTTAQSLYDAFHTYGWVYLKDFGIRQEEVGKMFSMSKSYFDQPLDTKLKNKLTDAVINQGYTPDGAEVEGEHLTSHKECYEHRRFNNDRCPTEEEMKGFKSFLDEFYMKLHHLANHVLRALALILHLPPTYFQPLLAKADHQLRLLHYMPIAKRTILSAGHARIHPHTDFGLCTILFQDSIGGLEVDPFHTGSFVPATPVSGSCVINVADLLQRLSNDRLRSTRHRVTAPRIQKENFEKLGEDGTLPARYSTAFFVHPGADVVIQPIVGEGEAEAKYESVTGGEWRVMNTAKNYSLPVTV